MIATFRSVLFNPSEGFVQAQAAGLTRYQPIVFGLRHIGNVLPDLEDRLLLPASKAERLQLRLGFGSQGLAVRLRRLAPALVHAHFGTDALLALPVAEALGIPMVTSLRGYEVNLSRLSMLLSAGPPRVRYALLRRRLMRNGALFLAVCDDLRRRAVAQGFPEDRTLTHYNGVDLTLFRPAPEPSLSPLVLYVGRLVEKKGIVELLQAFAAVRREVPGASLVIIGSGPEEARIRESLAGFRLDDSVQLIGHRPKAEIAEWMRRACVLAAPSRRLPNGDGEGLPNVVVEAAASGLPVVATRHNGIPEAVIDGETGFLVGERDTAALSARIAELLQSPRLRVRMGAAARRLAERRFDAATQMQRLEQHYDRLAAMRATGPAGRP